MLPLGDDNSNFKIVPFVTYSLILANVLVFFLELAGGEEFIRAWAITPSKFLANPAYEMPTLFTAMFMHAGWGHLLGNMLYLWIFGDNVENNFGSMRFLVFYLICGAGATFAQLYFNPHSNIPNLGASGAIAGVLAAYMVLFPKGKIKVIVGNVLTQMSALIVIGLWFLLQFSSGYASLSEKADVGGVAYMAHIGGFLVGAFITFFLRKTDAV